MFMTCFHPVPTVATHGPQAGHGENLGVNGASSNRPLLLMTTEDLEATGNHAQVGAHFYRSWS